MATIGRLWPSLARVVVLVVICLGTDACRYSKLSLKQSDSAGAPNQVSATSVSIAETEHPQEAPPLHQPMSPEMASRRGLRAIRWLRPELDLYQPRGRIILRRELEGCWLLELRGYLLLPDESLWLRVRDDGRVENHEGPVALPGARQSPPVRKDTQRLVPEEAIRILLKAVKKQFPGMDATQPAGVYEWSRGPGSGWTLNARHFDGIPLRRCWGRVEDDSNVDVRVTP